MREMKETESEMEPVMDRLLKEKLHRGADTLKGGIYRREHGLALSFAVTEEPVPFVDHLGLQYNEICEGKQWSSRVWDCAWFHITGKADNRGGAYLALDIEGEGCVYDRQGVPVRGITNVSSEFDRALGFPGKRYIPLCELLQGGETELDIWVDAANNDLFGGVHSGVVKECAVVRCDEKRRSVFYDYVFLHNLMESVPATDPLLTFYAVGHSHLDLAWKKCGSQAGAGSVLGAGAALILCGALLTVRRKRKA